MSRGCPHRFRPAPPRPKGAQRLVTGRTRRALNFFLATLALAIAGCKTAPKEPEEPTRGAFAFAGPNELVNLHVKLRVDPDTGVVTYFGWYDGRRNLLGPNGITTQLVGMEPPEVRGQLRKTGPTELRFAGVDQNNILWEKSWRLDESAVDVTVRVTNRRDDGFDAIVYAMPDLPDAQVTGDNRDLHISTPIAHADFHAEIDNPNFPGEQFNPFAMRSDSHHLRPGESTEFKMRWSLRVQPLQGEKK